MATFILLTLAIFTLITWFDSKANADDDFNSVAEWHNFQSAFDKKRKR